MGGRAWRAGTRRAQGLTAWFSVPFMMVATQQGGGLVPQRAAPAAKNQKNARREQI